MTKSKNLAAVAAPVLPVEPEGLDAHHPQLPGLARTAPPQVAIALPVPNAPKVTAKALARAMRSAEFWSHALFSETEAPVVERAAPARRPRRTYAERWEQRWLLPELAPKRHLALVGPDPLPLPGYACLVQAKGCMATSCRHHLGETRQHRGVSFTCAVDVANAYPHGLPPVFVARLTGLPEGYVQSAEKTVARRHGPTMAKLWTERYDHLPKKRSKAVKRIWFLGSGRGQGIFRSPLSYVLAMSNEPKVDLVWEELSSGGPKDENLFRIPAHVHRARVHGGWLVWALGSRTDERSGLVFVPDPDGWWGRVADEKPPAG